MVIVIQAKDYIKIRVKKNTKQKTYSILLKPYVSGYLHKFSIHIKKKQISKIMIFAFL